MLVKVLTVKPMNVNPQKGNKKVLNFYHMLTTQMYVGKCDIPHP